MIIPNTFKVYTDEIMNGFQRNKGRGSCYCLNPLKPAYLIASCIISYCKKRNNEKQLLIILKNYEYRKDIRELLKQLEPQVEHNIKILSKDYVTYKYHYSNEYVITCGIDDMYLIEKLYYDCKFMLSIFTEQIMIQSVVAKIRTLLPNIETSVNSDAVRRNFIYLPVEETHIGVELSNEDKEKYDKCTNFINESVKIFGDLKNIEKCKRGCPELNISAASFRTTLAYENGWNETLDTNVELLANIDKIYNPNTLFERACTFYNITSERRNIITDNYNKIKEIANICLSNPDKKILIVSKRGEFAANITRTLNEFYSLKCLDYHDNIEDCMLVDDNNVPVLYKTGVNKGKPRIIKAVAISKRNLEEFNKGNYNILSIKYSSDNKLNTKVDIIIITDSLHDNITEIRTRFSEIYFNENPTKCYRLYCKNTIEEKAIRNYSPDYNIRIIEDNNQISYNEETGDIII